MNYKNTKILFLALSVAALTSCSTAYKMGQTPDDVYYSPGKTQSQVAQDDYVSTNDQPQRYRGQRQDLSRGSYDSYEDFDAYRNDRFLRMSIGNTLRMGAFNDYYMYDGYSNWKYNNYAYNTNTPWNSYYYWNSYFNPYNNYNFYNPYYGGGYYGGGYGGGGGIIIDKSTPSATISRPRAFAPSSYTNNNYSNSNLYLYRNSPTTTTRPGNLNTGSRYNNANSGNSNSTMRRLPASGNTYYNTNTNTNNNRSTNSSNNRNTNSSNRENSNTYTPQRNNTYDAPTRSYTPTQSSSSGSSSSGSSSGGGVSRPSRGN